MRRIAFLLISMGMCFHSLFAQDSPPVIEVDTTPIVRQLFADQSFDRLLALDNSAGGSKLIYQFVFGRLVNDQQQEPDLIQGYDLSGEIIYVPTFGLISSALSDRGATVRKGSIFSDATLEDATIIVLNNFQLWQINPNRITKVRNWILKGGTLIFIGASRSQSTSANRLLDGTGIESTGFFGSRTDLLNDFNEHPTTKHIEGISVTRFYGFYRTSEQAIPILYDNSSNIHAAVSYLGAGNVIAIAHDIFANEEGAPNNLDFYENLFSYGARRPMQSSNNNGGLDAGLKGFLSLAFDARGLANGRYEGAIRIETNVPSDPVKSVPVFLQICDECEPLIVNPKEGAPGDTVLLTSYKSDVTTASFVKFNDQSTTFGIVDSATIFAVVPENSFGTGTFKANIDGTNQRSDEFKIKFPVFSLSDTIAQPGDSIYLSAPNIDLASVTAVRFKEQMVSFSVLNQDSLLVIVPTINEGIDIFFLETTERTYKSEFFQVDLPEINSNPSFGERGDTVVLSSGSLMLKNASAVRVQGVTTPFTVENDTTLSVVIPPNAINGSKFQVILDGVTYSTASFIVLPREASNPSTIKFAKQSCDKNGVAIDINWTQGNGSGVIIVVKESDNPLDFVPEDTKIYEQGLDLESGNLIFLPKFDPFRKKIYTLAQGVEYKISLYTYTGQGEAINYSLDSSVTFLNTIVAAPPVSQVNSLRVFKIGSDTVQVRWNKGNGDKTIVVITKDQVTSVPTPENCESYSANREYGTGDSIVTEFSNGSRTSFVVYNGLRNFVNISGLEPFTRYTVAAFSFNKTSFGPQYQQKLTSSNRESFRTVSAPSISAYPNPFSHSTNIMLADELNSPVELTVVDLSGNVVMKKQVSTSSDLKIEDGLNPGTYILKVMQNDRIYQQVIIKE